MTESITTGSDRWWASKTGPEWRQEGDSCRVTFWWRDPAGAGPSPLRRVWIYLTGVTDHHAAAPPQTLSRLSGTDVWQWQTRLPSRWRGSYCFIPREREDDFPPAAFNNASADPAALREGWRRLLPRAVADPLNPHSWLGGRGHPFSALSLPQAPAQPGWDAPAASWNPPQCIRWRSARLGNARRVWIYHTGGVAAAERPLAILLDGQFWAQSMTVWPALAALTAAGELPAAVYLLIDAIDANHRRHELPCNADFWLAVQQELLPQVQRLAMFSDRPDRTLVAGQSFGGLSALYAAVNWPQRFGCALCQSGSYWWPQGDGRGEGAIFQLLDQRRLAALRVTLQAGAREPLIFDAAQALLAKLRHTAATVFWEPGDGGHDALCWRGGLTAGLMQLWRPLMQTSFR